MQLEVVPSCHTHSLSAISQCGALSRATRGSSKTNHVEDNHVEEKCRTWFTIPKSDSWRSMVPTTLGSVRSKGAWPGQLFVSYSSSVAKVIDYLCPWSWTLLALDTRLSITRLWHNPHIPAHTWPSLLTTHQYLPLQLPGTKLPSTKLPSTKLSSTKLSSTKLSSTYWQERSIAIEGEG